MHHYNKFKDHHEGTVENCCGCLDLKCGSYTLGVFLVLQMIQYVVLIASGTSTNISSGIFGLLYIAYPTVRFLQMVKHNDADSRHHFASAYGCFAKFNSVLFAIAGLVFIIVAIYFIGIGATSIGLYFGLAGIIIASVGIMLNLHYAKVVHSYAHQEDHHEEGFKPMSDHH